MITNRRHLPPVEIDVEPTEAGWRVTPRGDLDVVGGPRLADALARAERGQGDVEVDLGEVDLVDSAGLRSLLRAEQRLAAVGRRLRLVEVDERLRRLLEITGLTSRLLG